MKRIALFLTIAAVVASPAFLRAEEKDGYPPVGMEILKVGDTSVVVPKGTRIRKEGDLNVIEDISEYASRRFVDVEDRFEHLEKRHDALKASVEEKFTEIEARQELLEEDIEHLRRALRRIETSGAGTEDAVKVNVQLHDQEGKR